MDFISSGLKAEEQWEARSLPLIATKKGQSSLGPLIKDSSLFAIGRLALQMKLEAKTIQLLHIGINKDVIDRQSL